MSSSSQAPTAPPTTSRDASRNIMEESMLAFEEEYGAGSMRLPTTTLADMY